MTDYRNLRACIEWSCIKPAMRDHDLCAAHAAMPRSSLRLHEKRSTIPPETHAQMQHLAIPPDETP